MTSAEAARDEAIDRASANAEAWCRSVVDLIREAPLGHEFTTDELWSKILASNVEPRAMGAALNEARRVGLVEPTGRYRKSTRRECHARPVLVWRRR